MAGLSSIRLRGLKKILPQTLFGRFAMIILLPTVLVQLFAIFIFYDRHWSSVTGHMTNALAGDVALITQQFNDKSPSFYPEIMSNAERFLNLNTRYDGGEVFKEQYVPIPSAYEKFAEALQDSIIFPFAVYEDKDKDHVLIHVGLPKGVLYIEASAKRLTNPTTYIFILWMTGSSILMLIISILFIRGQTRSIIRLAEAADAFGRGLDDPDFSPSGAKEVRQAGFAFVSMKERIKRLLRRRTEMLAGVSHDIRTRLTRMKLQLAMIRPNKHIKALTEDIAEMDAMITSYLTFAREGIEEDMEEVVLSKMLEDLLSSYRNHEDEIISSFNIPDDILIHGSSTQLKRALGNVIDNALRYAGKVTIRSKDKRKFIVLLFDDNGPGIAKEHHDDVFQPFFRLEDSRNVDTGGTGLGLSISGDIIHRHGGDITLEDSPEGGLRVVVKLPKS